MKGTALISLTLWNNYRNVKSLSAVILAVIAVITSMRLNAVPLWSMCMSVKYLHRRTLSDFVTIAVEEVILGM